MESTKPQGRNSGVVMVEEMRRLRQEIEISNENLHRIDVQTRGIRTGLNIILGIIVFSFLFSLMAVGSFGR